MKEDGLIGCLCCPALVCRCRGSVLSPSRFPALPERSEGGFVLFSRFLGVLLKFLLVQFQVVENYFQIVPIYFHLPCNFWQKKPLTIERGEFLPDFDLFGNSR